MKLLHLILLSVLPCLSAMGQIAYNDTYFYYEDAAKTIITALTPSSGKAAENLTIPAQVTKVKANAFEKSAVKTLTIEDGGDPDFDETALAGADELETFHLGTAMTVEHMRNMFIALGERGKLTYVHIKNYDTSVLVNWDDATMKAILTNDVQIIMPAPLVGNQVFGNAIVYGVFEINYPLNVASFCGSVLFEDTDDGSNYLFYVATGVSEDKRINIKRVHYITPNQGILMHFDYTNSWNTVVKLKRLSAGPGTDKYNADLALYAQNMLVGVTTPTAINATDGDKTNYILYNNQFHRTSGGTLGANRAYLQVPTGSLSAVASYPLLRDEETTVIDALDADKPSTADSDWYDLSGRKLNAEPQYPGMYIKNGKKIIK